MSERPRSLREWLETNRALSSACLYATQATIALSEPERVSLLGDRLEQLRGRSVLLSLHEPLAAALALLELDGVARRMVLCPPDLQDEHVPAVIAASAAQVYLTDRAIEPSPGIELLRLASSVPTRVPAASALSHGTEWILLSSGTTGVPKLIVHTIASLCAPLQESSYRGGGSGIVWSTFYDIRRYGGLQILLRALHEGSLLLAAPQEAVSAFLARAARAGVTHISGTPSHWRAALMSGAAASIDPRYVRLSGEIADQGILERLRTVYPRAELVHAFASTEAGLAFEVTDGLAGFPAALLSGTSTAAPALVAGVNIPPGVELRLESQTLRIRSGGNARGYLGAAQPPLRGADGFVDTGDRLELRDGRYHFAGRTGGIINVGGRKVHPEEIEAVINAHPGVRMSRVSGRRSPITGALVIAEILPMPAAAGAAADAREQPDTDDTLRSQVLEWCRDRLPPHKVPAAIHIVERLEMSAAGKLLRANQ